MKTDEEKGTKLQRVFVADKLFEELIIQIRKGKLNPGMAITPEKKLAQMYGISYMSARKAVTQLANQGLLYRKQGKGTFVAKKGNKGASAISIGMVGNISEEQFFRAKYYANIIETVKRIIDKETGILSYQTKGGMDYQELFRNLEIVDGMLIFNPQYSWKDKLKELGEKGYPYIVVGGGFFLEEGINYVGTEQIEEAALAVSALLRKGYTKIGFVSNKSDHLTYILRLEGYKLALKKANLEVKNGLILFDERSAYEVECERLRSWLEQNDLDAVFLAGLPIPLEDIISILREKKGKNICVALYDDFMDVPIPDLHYLAIKQPLAETGRAAALTLLDLIRGSKKGLIKIGLKSELIEDGKKLIQV